jgi:hypothetical protein
MKKPKLPFAILLFSFFLLNSCTRNKTDLVSSTEQALVKNIWTVDYFFNNQDMTTEFKSSQLLFSSTGAVGFQKNGETIPGRWKRTLDVSKNEVITLQFNTNNAEISQLSQSWKLVGNSDNSLQFEESGGSDMFFRIKTQ